MNGVELMGADGHRGVMEAVSRSFPGALWQYCHVHFMRILMKLIPKKKQASISRIVKEALEKEALENETLISTAQEVPVKEGFNRASEMLEG